MQCAEIKFDLPCDIDGVDDSFGFGFIAFHVH